MLHKNPIGSDLVFSIFDTNSFLHKQRVKKDEIYIPIGMNQVFKKNNEI